MSLKQAKYSISWVWRKETFEDVLLYKKKSTNHCCFVILKIFESHKRFINLPCLSNWDGINCSASWQIVIWLLMVLFKEKVNWVHQYKLVKYKHLQEEYWKQDFKKCISFPRRVMQSTYSDNLIEIGEVEIINYLP